MLLIITAEGGESATESKVGSLHPTSQTLPQEPLIRCIAKNDQIVSGQCHDSDQRSKQALLWSCPAIPRCSALGSDPSGYLRSRSVDVLQVHSTPLPSRQRSSHPLDENSVSTARELRPSLASCLPALQTATPISQLTPETSFPCCGSWRRPLQCSSHTSSDAELIANEHNGERMRSSMAAAVQRREGGEGGASKVQ